VLIVVPFQFELSGASGAALADRDGKTRRADRTGKPAARHATQARLRRRDDEAHRRRGWLGRGTLAQQEDRTTCFLGPALQAARRRQVENFRIAAHFQEHRRQRFQPRRLLGNP
jgi:hypothetical protein